MIPISTPQLIFLCIAMFFASFVDSIAGGGGCISLPSYLLVGLPPATAFACNKTSMFVGTGLATYKYWRAGSINVRVAAISAVAGLIGSNISSHIVTSMDGDLLTKIVLCCVPLVVIFLLVKRDFGEEDAFETVPAAKVWWVSIVVGLILGMYDGLIGPGCGTFAIMMFASVLKFNLKTAGGNAKLFNFATGLGSFIHYLRLGLIIWPLALITMCCTLIGNYIGSNLALKKGNGFIRIMMVVAVAILLLRLGAQALGLG